MGIWWFRSWLTREKIQRNTGNASVAVAESVLSRIPSEKRSYEELWLSAKKKDDEPLAGSYRAEVRETCGPAAGESG